MHRRVDRATGASRASRRRLLGDCIRALGERGQSVIEEHYFRGSSLLEVAARLKTSVSAVKQLLYRSRKLLEECVNRRLLTEQPT